MQGLPRSSTRRVMGGIGLFSTAIETLTRSAGWKQRIRMCKNVKFIWSYFVFRSLLGMFLRRIGLGWSITLEKSSLSYFTISTIPRFTLRLIFELLNFSHLLSFRHFVTSATIWFGAIPSPPTPKSSFSYRRSLIRLNLSISKASKILLWHHFWLPFPLRCSTG